MSVGSLLGQGHPRFHLCRLFGGTVGRLICPDRQAALDPHSGALGQNSGSLTGQIFPEGESVPRGGKSNEQIRGQ